MGDIDYTRYYTLLNIPPDATLQELDQRYFEIVEYYTVQRRKGTTSAELELRLVDEAYGALLNRLLKDKCDIRSRANIPYTMQQVVTGQERMTTTSGGNADYWTAPARPRSLSPELDADSAARPRTLSPELDADSDLAVYYARGLELRSSRGDINDAPDRAVIVHAVNCQGVWGYGVAKELKRMCPAAFEIYKAHCDKNKPYKLVSTCLLIPPQLPDYQQGRKVKLKAFNNTIRSDIPLNKPRRWIACLFTSIGYGKPNMKLNNPGKDAPPKILAQTRFALEELRTRIEELSPSTSPDMTGRDSDNDKPGEIWSPKFNSGAFGVPWADTEIRIVEEFDGFKQPWTVVERDDTQDLTSRCQTNGDNID